jgi:hypothetical protein
MSGEALLVGDEVHLGGRYPVLGEQHADQQGADAVGAVDPDLLAGQAAHGRDARAGRGEQHPRVRPQGGGLGENAEPGARGLRCDVADITAGADVDLAVQLAGDDRLGTGYLLDRHVQPLASEKPVVLRDVQPGQIG